MRFLLAVIAESVESAAGTDDEMAAIDVFNAKLVSAGHWVMAAGVEAPPDAVVIDNRGAEPLVTKGPAVASPAHMAGFWIIEVPSREAALALATEGSKACNRRIEVRAFL